MPNALTLRSAAGCLPAVCWRRVSNTRSVGCGQIWLAPQPRGTLLYSHKPEVPANADAAPPEVVPEESHHEDQQQGSSGPLQHGPVLPPRPTPKNKRKAPVKPSSPQQQQPGAFSPSAILGLRVLGGFAVYSGLVGTTALALASITGINLGEAFRWGATPDLLLALQLSLPLQLLNLIIMAPDYQALAPEPPSVWDPTLAATPGERPADAASAGAATATMPPPPPAPAGVVLARDWGRAPPTPDLPPTLAVIRDAAVLTQGHYISNNATSRLTQVAEAGVIFVDVAAGEMLYRGVALTWLAHWLFDRAQEAGANDFVALRLSEVLAPGLPQWLFPADGVLLSMGTYEACEWAVVAGLMVFTVATVLQRSNTMQARITSALSVWAQTARRRTAALRLQQQQQKQADGAKDGAAAQASAGVGAANAEPQLAVQHQEQPGVSGRDLDAEKEAASVQRAVTLLGASGLMQASRDGLQVGTMYAIFVLTGGNLAASYTASVINQLVFSALQRQATMRVRKRNAEASRKLRAYTEQLKKMAAKRGKGVAAHGSGSADGDAGAQAPAAAAAEAGSTAGTLEMADGAAKGVDAAPKPRAGARVASEILLPEDSGIVRTIRSLDMLIDPAAVPKRPGSSPADKQKEA